MRRFAKDESGMTMALAVMMIALIGVMGAGILTFVTRDLNSVIEVNAGQRAQGIANAGLEAAKYQLSIVDALPSSYDSVVTAGNSAWYDNGTPGSGKTLTFEGNQIVVGIRYLPPPSNVTQLRDPNYAPEVRPTYYKETPPVVDGCNDANGDGIDDDFNPTGTPPDPDACGYENNRNYFRVTVRGNAGNAVRAVQAIYQTENFAGAPLANYASRDVLISGSSTEVANMSIFASRNLDNFFPDVMSGTDFAYGNWATIPGTNNEPNLYNATPRTDASGNPVTLAGVGVGGTITYSSTTENTKQKNKTASPQRYGYRDYDTNTDVTPILRPEFTANNTWGDRANQPTTMPGAKITFPFAAPNPAEDNQALAVLKEKAQRQNLYRRLSPGSSFTIGATSPLYPAVSKLNETVMFIEFANGSDDNPVYGDKGKVTYQASSGNPDDKVKGTIVVMHGNLEMSNTGATDTFQGAMIVRDGIDNDTVGATDTINCNNTTSSIMYYCSAGNSVVEGYINVEGDLRLAGDVAGILPSELYAGLPGLVKVSRWSWRECYNTTCS